MAQCWYCRKVKGKRICPARGGELICPRCCGSKRRVEIHCPPSCRYLHGTHDSKWTSQNQEREAARFFASFLSLSDEAARFYVFLHQLLTKTSSPLSQLGDVELSEVLGATAKTLETLAKGVLYRHHASSPHLEPASDWLFRVVTARKNIESAPEASDASVLEAMVALHSAVDEHGRAGAKERYLDAARRLLADSLREAPPLHLPDGLDEPPSRLVVPP
jgi:hypothetical protein